MTVYYDRDVNRMIAMKVMVRKSVVADSGTPQIKETSTTTSVGTLSQFGPDTIMALQALSPALSFIDPLISLVLLIVVLVLLFGGGGYAYGGHVGGGGGLGLVLFILLGSISWASFELGTREKALCPPFEDGFRNGEYNPLRLMSSRVP